MHAGADISEVIIFIRIHLTWLECPCWQVQTAPKSPNMLWMRQASKKSSNYTYEKYLELQNEIMLYVPNPVNQD